MARLHAAADGTILRFLHTEEQERQYGAPPGTAFTITFDEDANPTVIANLNTDWNTHDAVGGVLRRNGTPVALAPNGTAFTERAQFAALDAKVSSGTNLTAAEMQIAIRILWRAVKRLIR